jgi:Uma2 family endonuclease
MVVCSALRAGDPFYETDARLVVEVLSESTASYDRSEKAMAYRLLPGLSDYLLVAQDQIEVTCLHKAQADWSARGYGPGEPVTVLGGELTIPVNAIYERLLPA